MHTGALSLQWDERSARWLGALVLVLVGMTLLGLALRAGARSDKARGVAADFWARTLGWWMLIGVFAPAALAGGWLVVAVFGAASLVTWREFCGVVAGAETEGRGGRGLWRAAGFVYCVGGLAFAPLLALRFGTAWLFFVMAVVQAGDVFQYGAGKLFGRRPLAPWLSPKKTWEGLLGGVAATAGLGALLGPELVGASAVGGMAWGLGLALAGSAGGLAMSAVKRLHGAKDFGAWIPGHGGLLDRVDSLVAATVFAYGVLVLAGASASGQ